MAASIIWIGETHEFAKTITARVVASSERSVLPVVEREIRDAMGSQSWIPAYDALLERRILLTALRDLHHARKASADV